MRIALGQFRELGIDDLRFARQIGASGITLNSPDFQLPSWRALLGRHGPYRPAGSPPPAHWEYMDLVRLRTMVEDQGLRLEALENVPGHFIDGVHLGLPTRDEQIVEYRKTIENMGRAGITTLGYSFNMTRVWRTSQALPGRGGALMTAFDAKRLGDTPHAFDSVIDADTVWENYRYFIEAVLPTAEKAGVRLALHPDDPPTVELAGAARIMTSAENLDRALAMGDSPYHGLDFCMGTMAEAGVDGFYDVLEHFAAKGKVFYAHVRNVRGRLPDFSECFIDEGDIDIPRTLRILRRCGFDGFLIDDHVPGMVGDSAYGHRAHAHATGYLQGVLQAISSA